MYIFQKLFQLSTKYKSFLGFGLGMMIAAATNIPTAVALPQGGQVAGGNVTINHSANQTQITQGTQRGIVNWQSYNVKAGELVQYNQPNRSSITLNRINPAQGASQIYGSIRANGQVWLVNGAGIHFGPGSHVDVAGIVATTSNIRDDDFMSGQYRFVDDSQLNGSITNAGTIKVRHAGLAAFIGANVSNEGLIVANRGTVVLGASKKFTVDFSGDQLINFESGGELSNPHVSNSGRIKANGGKVFMTAQTAGKVLDNTINMSGVIEAKSVGMRNGSIILGGGGGTVKISGKMIASGKKAGHRGGKIMVKANKVQVEPTAVIDVSGDIAGGEVNIFANERIDMNGVIAAQGLAANAQGGQVVIDSSPTGISSVGGQIDASALATNGKGGIVKVLGGQVGLVSNATINVSGDAGGGTVLMGGDYQGKGSEPNSQYAYMGKNTAIIANAITAGNGGKVILWSDIGTSFYGSIEARGGAVSGNGGFVETSGKAFLEALGSVHANAANGAAGVWLLDPANVTISNAADSNGSFDGGSPNEFTTSGNNANASVGTIEGSLNLGTNVVILTTPGGGQAGNITVADTITKSGGGDATLTLTASNDIVLNTNVDILNTSGGDLNVILNAGAAGNITLNGGSNINTASGAGVGGDIVLNAGTGGITMLGTSSLTVGNSDTIALDGGDGVIAMSANSSLVTGDNNGTVNITNFSDATLGTIVSVNDNAVPTLTVNSGGNNADIVQAGGVSFISAANASFITANGDITLTQANRFDAVTGSLILTTTGTGNISVMDTNDIELNNVSMGTGSLTVETSRDILQTPGTAITQTAGGGAVTFIAGTAAASGTITLTNANNNFTGTVSASTDAAAGVGDIDIRDINSIVLGGDESSVSSGNDFTVIAGNGITIDGDITTVGAGNINLTSGVTGINSISGIITGGSGGVITLNATNGDINLSNASLISTNTGTLGININTANDVILGDLDAGIVSAQSGLTMTAITGNITQALGTSVSMSRGIFNSSGNIILANSGNEFNANLSSIDAITSAGSISFADQTSFRFGSTSFTGTLTATAVGAIAQETGTTINQTGAGAISFSAGTTGTGGNINLPLGNTFNGAISAVTSASNGAITLNNTTSTILASVNTGTGSAGNFTLTSDGAITQTGAVIVGGTTSLTAGAGNNIILSNASNNFIGALRIVSGNNVTLTDSNALRFGAAVSTISGNLIVNTSGIIDQTGRLNVSGTSLFNTNGTSGATITLTDATNTWGGNVRFTNSVADVQINADASGIGLGATTITGADLTVTSLGGIAINGLLDPVIVTLTSATNITQAAAIIADQLITSSVTGQVLTNAGNQIGIFDATNSGAGAITLVNTVPLTIQRILQSGAGGAISVTNTRSVTLDNPDSIASPGITAGNNTVFIQSVDSNIILNEGNITSSYASGANDPAIELVNGQGATDFFQNNIGSNALQATDTNGYYWIWSFDPDTTGEDRGGLHFDFAQYGITFPTAPAQSTGDAFLYANTHALTVSLVEPPSVTKVYDGNTNATLATANYSIAGIADGDTINLSVNGTPITSPTAGTYDNKNVGTGKDVTVNNLTFTATNSDNGGGPAATVYGYTLTSTSATGAIGVITPLTLTVVDGSVQANDKVYDGTTTATLVPGTGTLTGAIPGDSVSLDTTGAFGNFITPNAGTDITVNVNGLTLTGADASNYTLPVPNATTLADITRRPISLTNDIAQDKIFDGNNIAQVGGSPTWSGLLTGDSITIIGGTAFFTSSLPGRNIPVNILELLLGGPDGGNYEVTSFAPQFASIFQSNTYAETFPIVFQRPGSDIDFWNNIVAQPSKNANLGDSMDQLKICQKILEYPVIRYCEPEEKTKARNLLWTNVDARNQTVKPRTLEAPSFNKQQVPVPPAITMKEQQPVKPIAAVQAKVVPQQVKVKSVAVQDQVQAQQEVVQHKPQQITQVKSVNNPEQALRDQVATLKMQLANQVNGLLEKRNNY